MDALGLGEYGNLDRRAYSLVAFPLLTGSGGRLHGRSSAPSKLSITPVASFYFSGSTGVYFERFVMGSFLGTSIAR